MEGMAFQQATHSKIGALGGAVHLDGFQRIAGATGVKAASWPQQGADEKFVCLDQAYQQALHRSTSFSQCFCKDFLNNSRGAPAASPRANTTISTLTICSLWSLKLSLAVLLMRFLATAFFIVFLAIANPSRGNGSWFGVASTVKYLSVDLIGLSKTFLKSAGVPNRNCAGKPKSSPDNQTVNDARPLARRALMTLRPPTVAILARKPWVRTRLILLGWYVLFMAYNSGRKQIKRLRILL